MEEMEKIQNQQKATGAERKEAERVPTLRNVSHGTMGMHPAEINYLGSNAWQR